MEIKTAYEAPFGLIPALRLTDVKRWGIVSMSKQQSVAEHVFGVMHITMWLCDMLDYSETVRTGLLHEAINHDNDEIYSGDIPHPAKHKNENFSKTPDLVKLADLLESINFFRQYCTDTDKVYSWIDNQLYIGINQQLKVLDINFDDIVCILNRRR